MASARCDQGLRNIIIFLQTPGRLVSTSRTAWSTRASLGTWVGRAFVDTQSGECGPTGIKFNESINLLIAILVEQLPNSCGGIFPSPWQQVPAGGRVIIPPNIALLLSPISHPLSLFGPFINPVLNCKSQPKCVFVCLINNSLPRSVEGGATSETAHGNSGL